MNRHSYASSWKLTGINTWRRTTLTTARYVTCAGPQRWSWESRRSGGVFRGEIIGQGVEDSALLAMEQADKVGVTL